MLITVQIKTCHITDAHIYYLQRQKVTAKHRSLEMERECGKRDVGKEMDKSGKRSQTPRISISCSLKACILYSFSSSILAATFLSTFCKPAQENRKCVGTSHHHNPVTVVKQSKPSSIYFQDTRCIRAVKTTPCCMWTSPLRVSWEDSGKMQLVGSLQAHQDGVITEFTFPFDEHPWRSSWSSSMSDPD